MRESRGHWHNACVGRGLCLVVAVAAVVLAFAGTASAAQLIDRDASGVRLEVDKKGEALLTYRKGGALKHVLVWGAVNALPPAAGEKQVHFRVDYSGGWGKYHTLYWQHFANACKKYNGPSLPNVVAECRAPDGSYWAAQAWPQPLPDLGFTPWLAAQREDWLELSHWSGPVAQLQTGMHWVYDGRFQSIYGRFTYGGEPVYGFGTTQVGAPTDSFGRLIYLDTFDSTYGTGWRRENSFVTHHPTGVFCYGFYTFDPTKGGYQHPPGQTAVRGPGVGTQYRLFAEGPGVTPDVAAVVPGLHAFDASSQADVQLEQQAAQLIASWGDTSCKTS